MAGENNLPRSSSATNTNTNKSSSSDHRKSRWQSSSSTPTTTATTTTNPPSSQTPSKKPPTNSNSNPPNSTPPSRPSSNKLTPKHALNNNNNNNNSTPTPSSQPPPFPFSPPPQPTYGFHMLDRRTIVLADGTVRSYFALPPDYQDFTPPPPRPPLGRYGPPHDLAGGPPDGPFGPMSMKRKFGFGDERERERDGGSNSSNNIRDEFARQKQQVLQYGNAGSGLGVGTGTSSSPFKREDEFRNNKYMRVAGGGAGFGGGSNNIFNDNVGSPNVEPAIMKAFLNFVKVINENANQKKNYLENGKHGPLQCLACARSSKEFPDVHALIMHAYNAENADLRADHLGLHRAICVVMGWNYLRAPDNSRAYQLLPPEEAAAYQDDLIMWPPMVIINNTNTGKGKDGRMEGLGNKAMDSKLRDLGFSGGKSKSLYCRDGHLGITLIKFPSEQSGLKEAMRLADHFEKEHHGRRDWARVKSIANDRDEESNPNLVMVDQRTGERRRILYGYLATVSDLDKVDYETRKKVVIESKHEKLQPSK